MRAERLSPMFATCVCAWGLVLAAGCQKEEPTPEEKTAVPKIPTTASGKETPPPITPARPTPAIPRESSTAAAPAKEPGAAEAMKDTPAPAEEASPTEQPDAEDTPAFLRPQKVGEDWVKSEPVRVALPGALDALLKPETVKVAAPYQIKMAAACSYRPAKGAALEVELLAVEAHRVEDAYGLFTVLAPAQRQEEKELLLSVSRGDKGTVLRAWKGRYYLRMEVPVKVDSKAATACRALLHKISFPLPSDDRPEVIRALPPKGLASHQQWMIREWISLQGPGAKGLKIPPGKEIATVLGLNRDTLMLVATYEIPGARRPHRVWVVRYDQPKEARDAYQRYRVWLKAGTDRWSDSTMVLPPAGPYLVGTWTAEEESLAPVLPQLRSNLDES